MKQNIESHLPDVYVAVDLGASSGRIISGKLVDQRLIVDEIYRFPTPLLEKDQRLYWDLTMLWAEIQAGLKEVEKTARVRSISVDSWAVDYVRIGPDGQALSNPFAYRDEKRNAVMNDALDIMSRHDLYSETGIQFLPFNSVFQHFADHTIEAFRDTVKTHLMIADYFNYLLSGEATIELSNASTTQLMNVRTREWSDEVFHRFDFDRQAWPKIVPSGTVLGPARVCSGTRVIASLSHDTGAAVAAVPADENTRWCYISSGTWSLLGAELSDPITTDEAREAGFTNEAGYKDSIRFLKNLTGLWALQECFREWLMEDPSLDYPTLLNEASMIPPNQFLFDLEDPVFLPPGGMVERIRSFCTNRGLPRPESRGEITRAILENIAASYSTALGHLEKLTGQTFDVIHVVGGGSQNALLCQITADVTGRTVVAGPAEATALGNLLVQADSLNELPPNASIRSVVRNSFDLFTFFPNT